MSATLIDNLLVFDLADDLVAILTPEDINTPYGESIYTEQLNRAFNFNFVVPASNTKADFIVEGNQVAFKDLDGNFQLFEIKRIEEIHGEILMKSVFCEHAIFELLDEFIEFDWQRDKTATVILTAILSGTRWTPGTVTAGGATTETVRMELNNPIEALYKMVEAFSGGEFRFRVTISGTSISTRYVDYLVQRGAVTGKRFEYSKDLVFIQREVNFVNVKTELYGYGKAEEVPGGITRVNFADVEWTIAGSDPLDKPYGDKFLTDPAATLKWGRADGTRPRIGIFEDPDITDPNELLDRTYEELEKLKNPIISYTMRIVDLERISGLAYEDVRLGDTIVVIDREFQPELFVTARVVEIKRFLTEPERDEVVLDAFKPLSVDSGFILQNVTQRIQNTQGVWQDSSYTTNMVNDHSFENIPRAIPGGPPPADSVYDVLKTVPDYGSELWWQWDGTGKVISTYDETTLLANDQLAMFDFQAAVVDSDSEPYQYMRLNSVVGLNGPYTASVYVAAYSLTATDGIAILEIYPCDSSFSRLSSAYYVETEILSAEKNKWKRIDVTLLGDGSTFPGTTEFLEVYLTYDSGTPALTYLADGVQLVPLDSVATYNPESQLWRHMRRFPGLKLQFPTFDGDVTIREGNLIIPEAETFSAYQSVSKSIPNSVWTIIDYNIELFDPDSIYDNTTYQFTTWLATGRFIVTAKCRLDNIQDTSLCAMAIYINSVRYHIIDTKIVGGLNDPQLSGSAIIDITDSDVVDIRVIQTQPIIGAVSTLPNQQNTHWQAHRLS